MSSARQVLADYECADEPNGSGLDSCDGSVADGAAVDTGSLGQKTFTVDASDHAGNTESTSVSYTVVDTKAPSIVVTTPAPGAVYAVGQQVAADYSCSDDGSGIASCVGSVANGAPLDTGSAWRQDLHGERHRQGGQPGVQERQLLRRRPDRAEHRLYEPDRGRGVQARQEGGRRLLVRRRAERLGRGDLRRDAAGRRPARHLPRGHEDLHRSHERQRWERRRSDRFLQRRLRLRRLPLAAR